MSLVATNKRYGVAVEVQRLRDGDVIGMLLNWFVTAGYVAATEALDFHDDFTSFPHAVHTQRFVLRCAFGEAVDSLTWASNIANKINGFHDAKASIVECA